MATLLEHGVTLGRALGVAKAQYPDFAPLVTLKALSYFDDGDLPALPTAVKRTLAREASGVRTPETVPLLGEQLI